MPQPAKQGYLPSLDGWRAVSILCVVLSHDDPSRALHGPQSIGAMGVYIFFAISGVLMAWRIQKDEAKAGRFDVRSFYVRRFFRIQPAAWFYLVVVAVLMITGVLPDLWRYWWGGMLAYRNFQMHWTMFPGLLRLNWFTGHFWSLSIEEHFYILLSAFFLAVRRNRILVMATGLLVLISAQRLAIAHGLYSPDISRSRTYWEIQFLLFPCLLSLCIQTARGMRWAKRMCRPWAVFTASAALVVAGSAHRGTLLGHDAWYLIQSQQANLYWLFGFWVIATTVHADSWTTRLLELRPLRYLGRLSYSMYLWQQLFLWKETPVHITWKPLLWAGQQPTHYASILAATLFSYYCIEKPMIRLGHRLAPPATPGHADLAVTAT